MGFNIGILISGQGSNMLNIIEACQANKLISDVNLVVSNNPDAVGIKKAEKKRNQNSNNSPIKLFKKKDFEDAINFELKKEKINPRLLSWIYDNFKRRVHQKMEKQNNKYPSFITSIFQMAKCTIPSLQIMA